MYVNISFVTIFLPAQQSWIKEVHIIIDIAISNARLGSSLVIRYYLYSLTNLIDFGVMHMNDNGWTRIDGM